MNTDRSDQKLEQLNAVGQRYERRVVSHEHTFSAAPDRLFPLLCPTAEYDWMEGWNCELIYAKSLRQEYNAIFKTDYFVPGEVWIVSQIEPNRSIEFVRVSEHMSIKVDVRISDNLDGTCTGHWIINATALTAQGNATLQNFKPNDEPIGVLIDALDHYVRHQTIKPLPDGLFNKQ